MLNSYCKAPLVSLYKSDSIYLNFSIVSPRPLELVPSAHVYDKKIWLFVFIFEILDIKSLSKETGSTPQGIIFTVVPTSALAVVFLLQSTALFLLFHIERSKYLILLGIFVL